jgi:putative oxidoreductase
MGACMAGHGYGKLFGDSFEGFVSGVEKLGLPFLPPQQWAMLAAWSEFAGGIFVIMGLATRVAAFLIFMTMCVAIFKVHWNDAFAMKEVAILYWSIAGALMLTGAGRFSIDAALLSHFGRGGGGK